MLRLPPVILPARLLLTLACMPAVLAAQSSAVLDEATFMVSKNGVALGRESFKIVRAPGPGGQFYRATGQSALGENRFTTSLGTDSLGVPVSYESDLMQRGEIVHRLRGRGGPGRFSVRLETKSGEAAREYLLNNGALLIDDDVIHHFFFVPLVPVRGAQLTVIAPRAGRQGRFRLEEMAKEMVEIAGRSISSRRFVLTETEGASRTLWIDEKGRLLKVAIPATGLVAVRDDPPR
jgi:hypothetical protein